MKLLVIQFEDTVDTSPLPKGTQVTVGDGTTTLSGEVMASVDILEPSLEGDYHITPIEPEPAPEPAPEPGA